MRAPGGVAARLSGALLLAVLATAGVTLAPAHGRTQPAQGPPATAEELLDRLEAAWTARDPAAYVALWDPLPEARRAAERAFAVEHFEAESTELRVERPARLPENARRLRVPALLSIINEPRGRFEQWLIEGVREGETWRLTAREPAGQIDGLVHLTLDPAGYRADGLTLRLEDFELRFERGSLFTTPPHIGPTVLVFVGRGRLRFTPRPATERRQLELFAGEPELDTSVETAFVRLHPADLHRFLDPVSFVPDAEAARRFGEASKVFEENASRSFVLDAPLPGSPWWVLPGLGDAAVSFASGKGRLTFSIAGGERESVNLFDHERRRQICQYPLPGRAIDYSEDEGRAFDLLHHEIAARFEPARDRLEAVDTLQLELLQPTTSVRLRLDDALTVRSVTSHEGGRHLFFRIRNQGAVLVSLGALAGRVGRVSLTVRYGGALPSTSLEQEALGGERLQIFVGPQQEEDLVREFLLEPVRVYTNRDPWYPQGPVDDFATASLRLTVPRGLLALAAGRRLPPRDEGEFTIHAYEQEQPGRYITVAVGKLEPIAAPEAPPLPLAGFAVPRSKRRGEQALALAAEVLRFYASEFGPMPYASLAFGLVEGRTPGGHSPPGMVLLQERPVLLRGGLRPDPAEFWDVPGFFLAHELAHQWWGHGVAGQNYHERWISEAFAQYAAVLWTRQSLGEERAREVLRRMRRWVERFADRGPIWLGYRLGHVQGEPQVYRAIAYNRGAFVLHMLRRLVGEDTFRAALHDVQARHRFSKVGTGELRQAFERAAGRDLGAYFEAWIHETRLPELHWNAFLDSAAEERRAIVSVRAQGLPGPVPLTITLTTASGRQERSVLLPPEGARFTLEAEERIRKVELNEDEGLLALVRKD